MLDSESSRWYLVIFFVAFLGVTLDLFVTWFALSAFPMLYTSLYGYVKSDLLPIESRVYGFNPFIYYPTILLSVIAMSWLIQNKITTGKYKTVGEIATSFIALFPYFPAVYNMIYLVNMLI